MPIHRTDRTRPHRTALYLAALLGIATSATAVRAVSFGSDLNAPANNTGTCSLLSSPSCTFFSGAPGPAFYAPLSGIVTAVRVKTGNFAQGPMQILVMRSLYQNNVVDPGHPFFACCFVERYGPIFTPAPNGVTTVPAALPMVEDPIPPPEDGVTNARGDFLALSVLDPNVPIPASFDDASVYAGFAPAPDPQTTPAPSPNPIFPVVNGLGYRLLMNADLTVGGGGGDAIPVAIATGGQLVGSTAAIPLTCVLTTACEGRLRLTNVPAAQATAVIRAKVYGKARFSIASGVTATVNVRLNPVGRRKTRRLTSVTLLATAKVDSGVATSTVELVRP
jgi:hypothetical protein